MNLGYPVFIEAKDDRGGGDNWTTGAISRAMLQSNHLHQQTNIQFLYRPDALPVAPTNSVKALKGNVNKLMMTFLSINIADPFSLEILRYQTNIAKNNSLRSEISRSFFTIKLVFNTRRFELLEYTSRQRQQLKHFLSCAVMGILTQFAAGFSWLWRWISATIPWGWGILQHTEIPRQLEQFRQFGDEPAKLGSSCHAFQSHSRSSALTWINRVTMMFESNHWPLLRQDTSRELRIILKPCLFNATPLRGSHWNCVTVFGLKKTRMTWLTLAEKKFDMFSRLDTIHECDGYTPIDSYSAFTGRQH